MARKSPGKVTYKYHHVGIPTRRKVPGMVDIPHLRIHATDHEANDYGIQWMKYDDNCGVPDLVRTVPHVAFEVNSLKAVLRGKKILIEPNSPSPGVLVAMVEEAGAPVEFLQFTNKSRNRRYRAREMKLSRRR